VGTVQEAVQRYKSGQLQPTAQPNVPPHFGMGWPGRGGFGMGRGRCWPSMSYGPTGGATPSPDQELQLLKQQADFLRQQLDAINKRISELEKN